MSYTLFMGTLVSSYPLFVQNLHNADVYKSASEEERKTIDNWLYSPKVKNCFDSNLIFQLSLHESLVLEIQGSDAFQARTHGEQKNIVNYMNSPNIRRRIDDLEIRLATLGNKDTVTVSK